MASLFSQQKANIEIVLKQNLIYAVRPLYFQGIISEDEVNELNDLSSDDVRVHTLMEILEKKITQNSSLFEVLQRIFQVYSNNDGDVEEYVATGEIRKNSNTSSSFSVCVRALPQSVSTQFESSLVVQPTLDSYTPTQLRKPAATMHVIQCHSKEFKHINRDTFSTIQFSPHCVKETVGYRGATIRGEGVQLRIPPNAIKKGCTMCVSIQGCLNGPFKLPDNVELISPIFLITCEPHLDFQHNTTLTIHHFANLHSYDECKETILLTSPQIPTVDEDRHVWKFHVGDQRPHCFPKFTHGEVLLRHFSFECFGIRRTRRIGKIAYSRNICKCIYRLSLEYL